MNSVIERTGAGIQQAGERIIAANAERQERARQRAEAAELQKQFRDVQDTVVARLDSILSSVGTASTEDTFREPDKELEKHNPHDLPNFTHFRIRRSNLIRLGNMFSAFPGADEISHGYLEIVIEEGIDTPSGSAGKTLAQMKRPPKMLPIDSKEAAYTRPGAAHKPPTRPQEISRVGVRIFSGPEFPQRPEDFISVQNFDVATLTPKERDVVDVYEEKGASVLSKKAERALADRQFPEDTLMTLLHIDDLVDQAQHTFSRPTGRLDPVTGQEFRPDQRVLPGIPNPKQYGVLPTPLVEQ